MHTELSGVQDGVAHEPFRQFTLQQSLFDLQPAPRERQPVPPSPPKMPPEPPLEPLPELPDAPLLDAPLELPLDELLLDASLEPSRVPPLEEVPEASPPLDVPFEPSTVASTPPEPLAPLELPLPAWLVPSTAASAVPELPLVAGAPLEVLPELAPELDPKFERPSPLRTSLTSDASEALPSATSVTAPLVPQAVSATLSATHPKVRAPQNRDQFEEPMRASPNERRAGQQSHLFCVSQS